jgi:hypothetical protein
VRNEFAKMLRVSRRESVPNLARRFRAWLATDRRAGERLSRLEEQLEVFDPAWRTATI